MEEAGLCAVVAGNGGGVSVGNGLRMRHGDGPATGGDSLSVCIHSIFGVGGGGGEGTVRGASDHEDDAIPHTEPRCATTVPTLLLHVRPPPTPLLCVGRTVRGMYAYPPTSVYSGSLYRPMSVFPHVS